MIVYDNVYTCCGESKVKTLVSWFWYFTLLFQCVILLIFVMNLRPNLLENEAFVARFKELSQLCSLKN